MKATRERRAKKLMKAYWEQNKLKRKMLGHTWRFLKTVNNEEGC